MKLNILKGGLALLCFVLSNLVFGQKMTDEERAVRALDSAFWNTYNICEVDAMNKYFTDDIEFYHDKGGKMKGIDELVTTTKRNLCSDDNFRLRREAVEGTVKYFPMQSDGKIYGAILSGQHVFYILQKGKSPRLDGLARFTHLWLLTESGWKMSRVISYDHGPAPYVNKRVEVKLSKKELAEHVGSYMAPNAGRCTVTQSNGLLALEIGDKTYELHPESRNLFFQTNRDLTFEFVDNKMIVRENGDVVEEASRSK
ncbi:nuclear transport factor 2 family protein [Chryseolinea sp. T2]|uniref:nuclear transport factor 2 family protein n=1 Tax=Chryseolinea sp. T2 TaxID=3129255 RepID=UPI0030778337